MCLLAVAPINEHNEHNLFCLVIVQKKKEHKEKYKSALVRKNVTQIGQIQGENNNINNGDGKVATE